MELVEISNSSLSHGQQSKRKIEACSYFYDLLRVSRNFFHRAVRSARQAKQAMSATSDIGIGNIPVSAALHGYNGCDVIGLHLTRIDAMPCHVMPTIRGLRLWTFQICRRHLPATVWESLWQMAGVKGDARKKYNV